MSPRARARHGEVTVKLGWSGSGSRSEITPTVERTVHLPPKSQNKNVIHETFFYMIRILESLGNDRFNLNYILFYIFFTY
ncbi:hypothetical protein Hanom_Chr04g00382121 [Helianthus anomalus]